MFLVGLISWWYGEGWRMRWQRSLRMLLGTAHYFSVGQLAGTLFSPYRQISAGTRGATPGDALSAFFDRLLSRLVGAVVRTVTIFSGLVALAVQGIFLIVISVLWGVVPLLPVIGAVLFALDWGIV